MRRTIRIVVILIVGFAALIAAGAFALRPPTLAVPSQGVVLSDITIVNPGRERRLKQTLTVQGEKITRLSDSTPPESASTQTDRFAGAHVLPGLIDMHVHFASYPDRDLFALLFLRTKHCPYANARCD